MSRVEPLGGGVVAEAGEEPVEAVLVCGGEPGPLVSSGVRRALTLLEDEAPTAQDEQGRDRARVG